MSSSDNSSTDASQEPTGVVDELVIIALDTIIRYSCIISYLFTYFQNETKEVDIIGKSNDILTKIELGFTGFSKEIIKLLQAL